MLYAFTYPCGLMEVGETMQIIKDQVAQHKVLICQKLPGVFVSSYFTEIHQMIMICSL